MSNLKKVTFVVPGKSREITLESNATYKDALRKFEEITGTSQTGTDLLADKKKVHNLNEVIDAAVITAVRSKNVSNL